METDVFLATLFSAYVVGMVACFVAGVTKALATATEALAEETAVWLEQPLLLEASTGSGNPVRIPPTTVRYWWHNE